MSTDHPFFKERKSKLVQAYLNIAVEHINYPESLSMDNYRNILASFHWCVEHAEYVMIIQFAYHLRLFFEQRGWLEVGIACVEQAITACKQVNDKQTLAQFYFTVGILCDRQGILDKAKEHYLLSIQAAQLLNNQSLLADGLHRLGWVHHRHGEFVEAEGLYIQAKNIREGLGDSVLAQSRSWHQLGILAQDRRDYDRAWEFYDKALLLREAAIHRNDPGARYLKAASLYQQGSLAKLQHKWAEAIRYFEESRDIRLQLDDSMGVADTLDQLGSVAYLQEDWTKAYEFYEHSLKQKQDRSDWSGAISIKIRLGEVRFKQNQLDNALSWFQDCLNDITCNKVLWQPYLESQIRARLGQVYLFFKPVPNTTHIPNYEAAIHHYEISALLLKDINGKQGELAGVLYQVGLSYFEWGYQAFEQKDNDKAKQRWQNAHGYYSQCLLLRTQMNSVTETAQTHLQLGMVSQALGDYSQAEHHFQKSYSLFARETNVVLQAQVLYRLGSISYIKNHNQRVIEYSQKAIQILQSHNLPVMSGLAKLLAEAQSRPSEAE